MLRNLNGIQRRALSNLVAADKECNTAIAWHARVHANPTDEHVVMARCVERLGEAIRSAVIEHANSGGIGEERAHFFLARLAREFKMERLRVRAQRWNTDTRGANAYRV
jgi:hypothetical protein